MPKKKKNKKKIDKLVNEMVKVDVLTLPTSLRISIGFGFDIKKEALLSKVQEDIDKQILEARELVHKKVARKLGVTITFGD